MEHLNTPIPLPPFSPDLEVIANPLWLYVDIMPTFVRSPLLRLLKEVGMQYNREQNWTPVAKVVKFYELVEEQLGAKVIFDLGKKSTNLLSVPPHVQVLSDMLAYFDEMYQANHKGGYAGFYQLLEYDGEKREYLFRIHTPYPRLLNKGVLTGFGRTYGNMVYVSDLEPPQGYPQTVHDQWFSITYR